MEVFYFMYLLILLFPMSLLITFIATNHPSLVESFYSRGFYIIINKLLYIPSHLISFSLGEILLYFTEQFEMIIRAIGNNSSESIFDDILYYIEHNYMTSLKLESIAPLFGYNSSYLGKLFSQKTGDSFNYYLDKVRIEHSKELLVNSDMKVYEIATKVGYKNVDYFHLKFKRHMNMTPAEYRKQFNLLLIQS